MNGSEKKQLQKAAKEALKDIVSPQINERCDRIEAYVKDYLTRTENREKMLRAWLMNEVKFKMQNDLFNATCTVDAIVEVLAESGITIPEFAQKVDARKLIIRERKIKEAGEKLEAEAKARAEEAAKAAEAKKNEPAPEAVKQEAAS